MAEYAIQLFRHGGHKGLTTGTASGYLPRTGKARIGNAPHRILARGLHIGLALGCHKPGHSVRIGQLRQYPGCGFVFFQQFDGQPARRIAPDALCGQQCRHTRYGSFQLAVVHRCLINDNALLSNYGSPQIITAYALAGLHRHYRDAQGV